MRRVKRIFARWPANWRTEPRGAKLNQVGRGMPNEAADNSAEPGPLRADADDLTKERRRNWRFLATYRVEYTWDDRQAISFMGNLSLGGMYLRGAQSLPEGEEIEFKLHLDDKHPLVLRGVVSSRQKSGVGIKFSPGQHDAFIALRRYVDESIIPKLERGVSGRRPSADKVRELAALYQEMGRHDDTLALLRRGLEASPRDLDLHERLVGFLWLRIRSGAERPAELLSELTTLIAAGLKLGDSEVLSAAQHKVSEIHRQVDEQEETARRRQEDELLAGKLEERVQHVLAKERRSLEHEFRARAEGIVLARQQELENTFEERVRTEIAKKLEEMGASTQSAVDKALTLAKLYEIQRADAQEVEAAVAKRRRELEEEHAGRLKLLEQQFEAREIDRERARAGEIKELRDQLAEAREALILATEELAVGRQQLVNQREDIATQVAALASEREGLVVQQAALDEQRRAIAEEVHSVARNGAVLAEQADAQRVEQSRLDELSLELNQRAQQMEQAAAAWALHQEELATRERQIEARAQELSAADASVNGKLAEIEAAEKMVERMDALAATKTTLERQLDQLQEELLGWQRRTDEALAAGVRAQERADAETHNVVAMGAECDALRTQLIDMQQVLATREAELAASREEVAERERALSDQSEAIRLGEQLSQDAHAELQAWRDRAETSTHEVEELKKQLEHERAQLTVWQERAMAVAGEVRASVESGVASEEAAVQAAKLESLSVALMEEKSYLEQESARLLKDRTGIEDRGRAVDEQQERLRAGWLALEQERADWQKTRKAAVPEATVAEAPPSPVTPGAPRPLRRYALPAGAALALMGVAVVIATWGDADGSAPAVDATSEVAAPAVASAGDADKARADAAGKTRAEAEAALAQEKAKKQVLKGHELLGKGKFSDAIREYKKAEALAPEDGVVHRSLGIAYTGLGNAEKAVAAYKSYLRLMPDAPDGAQLRAMIEEYEGAAAPPSPTTAQKR